MAHLQQQVLIEAPVKEVWALLSDPSRFPEWAADSVETTGVPTRIERGSTFEQKGPGGLSGRRTTFKVEDLDDLREIKLRCQTSGYYSHWRLTEAQGQTFCSVEYGVEPIGLTGQVARVTITKRHLRALAADSLDGMRRLLGREPRK